jgi:hypothetical protein
MTTSIAPTSATDTTPTPARPPNHALVMRCDECGKPARPNGYIKIDRAKVARCYEPVGDWEVMEVKRDRVYWHIVHDKCDMDATPTDFKIPTRLIVTNADLLETTAYMLRNQPELIVVSNWHGLIGRILYDTQERAQPITTLSPDDPRHGTDNGYTNYGCRCEPCRVAKQRATDHRRSKRGNNSESNRVHTQPNGTDDE